MGNGGAAALGAFVGSWLGNGFNGNGFGNNGAAAATVVASDAAVLAAINNLGVNVIQGQGQAEYVAAAMIAAITLAKQANNQ